MNHTVVLIRQPNGVYSARVKTSLVLNGKLQLGPDILNNEKVPRCRNVEIARTWADIRLRQIFKNIPLVLEFEEQDACPAA